jgi:hypothetical protein
VPVHAHGVISTPLPASKHTRQIAPACLSSAVAWRTCLSDSLLTGDGAGAGSAVNRRNKSRNMRVRRASLEAVDAAINAGLPW